MNLFTVAESHYSIIVELIKQLFLYFGFFLLTSLLTLTWTAATYVKCNGITKTDLIHSCTHLWRLSLISTGQCLQSLRYFVFSTLTVSEMLYERAVHVIDLLMQPIPQKVSQAV